MPPARRAAGLFDESELVSSRQQGTAKQYSGMLLRAGPVFRRPSPFCIIDRDGRGRGVTLCYVLGSVRLLSAMVGRRVRVEGAEYWLQGVRHAVLVPERIYKQK